MELISRLWPYLGYGPAAGALAVAKRGLKPWLEIGSIIVFRQPISEDAPLVLPGIVLRDIGTGDVPALARAFGRDGGDLWKRLERGDRGHAAFGEDGEPLHMRWSSTQATWIPEVELWLRPRRGEVYCYDAITATSARGRRLYDAARRYAERRLRDEGLRTKLVYVRSDNHAMWRALRNLTTERLTRLFYVRLAGKQPIVLGRLAPPLVELTAGAAAP